MKRAAYVNDISKKPTAVNVLGRIVKWLLIAILLATAGAAAFFGVRGYVLYQQAAQEKSVTQMVDDIKERVGENWTSLSELPAIYLDAVVAVEDHRFYNHPGFDVLATARAFVNDVRAGSIVEGGSTITQQLAKNEFFTQEQVIDRKIAEVFMAFDIENQLSKSEILELYVNSIYFGDGYYGIAAACEGYLGKEPTQMTAYESTLLAGTPNAPSAYAPTASPELAHQRQDQVLRQMVKYGVITQSQADGIAGEQAAADVRLFDR